LFKSHAVWASRGGYAYGYLWSTYGHFSDAGGYTKRPCTLEKIGIAVKEELEKQQFVASNSIEDYLYLCC
jgi:hypothetical protein